MRLYRFIDGLDAKEDLNVVIIANDNTWRKELTAENA